MNKVLFKYNWHDLFRFLCLTQYDKLMNLLNFLYSFVLLQFYQKHSREYGGVGRKKLPAW